MNDGLEERLEIKDLAPGLSAVTVQVKPCAAGPAGVRGVTLTRLMADPVVAMRGHTSFDGGHLDEIEQE